MPDQLPPLTPAGRHFGEAFCPPGDETCIRTVGEGWERRVEEAFGAGAGGPPVVVTQEVNGATGTRLGTLTYADGAVTLCLEVTPGGGGPRCRQVGQGVDGLIAVQQMLELLGMTTREVDFRMSP